VAQRVLAASEKALEQAQLGHAQALAHAQIMAITAITSPPRVNF
jgi:hypothetical protein